MLQVTIAAKTCLVSPTETIDGEMRVTPDRLIFLSANVSSKSESERENLPSQQRERSWKLSQVLEVYCRRYLLKNCAIELFFLNGTTIFVSFAGKLSTLLLLHRLPLLLVLRSAFDIEGALYIPTLTDCTRNTLRLIDM